MKKMNVFGKQTGRLLSLLWLLIYFSGIVAFNAIHRSGHEHAIVSHSTAQESDSCHRAIYHHETAHGCKHKAHYVPKTTCEYCDAFCSPAHESLSIEKFSAERHSIVFSENFQPSDPDGLLLNTPSRAPPVQG